MKQRFSRLYTWLGKRFEASLSLDLRSLAVARIGVGVLLLIDLAARVPDLFVFYSDGGVLSRTQLLQHYPYPFRWSLYLFSGAPELQFVLFLVAAVFAVMLIIGWNTKVATVLSWIFLVSLQNRNPSILNAGDDAFRLLLFWAMFLPWGQYWSVDARGKKPKSAQIFSVASFAFISQLAIVYLFSVVYKSDAQWTTDFTALYSALSIDQFTTRIGLILYQFPVIMRLLTFAVIRFELLGPILLYVPFFNGAIRTMAALGLAFMHLNIWIFMDIGIFSWIMIAFDFALVTPFFWDSLLPDIAQLGRKIIPSTQRINTLIRKLQEHGTNLISKLPTTREFKIPPKLNFGIRLAMDTIAAVCLMYIVIWNLAGIPEAKAKVPAQAEWFAQALRLDQKWNMFAPYPFLDDGWYLVTATGRDGKTYDLMEGGAEANFEKPELVSADYPNQRWRKYLMNLYQDGFRTHREYYLKYMCPRWKSHPQYQRSNLELRYVFEPTLPDYATYVTEVKMLGSVSC